MLTPDRYRSLYCTAESTRLYCTAERRRSERYSTRSRSDSVITPQTISDDTRYFMSAYNPNFNEEHLPLAYFITFRCYGTWLHGDERSSTDRFHNQYGTPFLSSNEQWQRYNKAALKHPPVKLDAAMRAAAEAAIREACEFRNWLLQAINVRTNHLHTVVSAPCKPEPVMTAFKSNATRKMRETNCWQESHSPWADKGSKRYLWTPRSVERATDYTINGQGDEIPDFNAAEDDSVQYRER